MKTLNIAILVALIGVFTVLCIQNVYAIPYMSPQDLYKQSDMVFHGQVISKQAGLGPDYYYYQIKVDTFFKNPQTSDSITAAGHKPADGRMEYPQFEIGDKAIFYTSKVDGVNTIGLFSQKAGMACDAQSFLGSAYLPNNAQSFSAVASNPRITDINGNAVVGKVQRGQPIQITYDEIWNNYPEYRTILLHMSIQDIVDTKPAFEENRTIFLNACDGPSPVKLNFVPEKNGTYVFSLNIDKKLTTSTSFDVGDSSYSVAMMTQSPLKQFKSGIKAQDVKCNTSFELVMKSGNNFPACIKPEHVTRLTQNGWTIPNPFDRIADTDIPNDTVKSSVNPDNQTSSTLKLFISTDSTYTSPGNPVGVDISLNNTSSTPLILTKSDNWPRNDLSSGPCSNLPFGMAILKGYYTEQNMSNTNSLVIFQNIPCPLPAKIKSYTFQPLSSKATQECDSLFSCTGLVDMKTHLEISGFVDNNSTHHPFSIGTYTIIAGDQWGHVAIQHFSEAYTTPLADLKGN